MSLSLSTPNHQIERLYNKHSRSHYGTHFDYAGSAIDATLDGKAWRVMAFPDGLNHRLLNKLYHYCMSYLNMHSKLFMIRFDVALYDSPEDNKEIGKLSRYITKKLESRYQSEVGFGWVREQNSHSEKCHYHCFVMLNGQKVRNTYTTFNVVKAAMKLLINITIHFPYNCSYMVLRNDLSSQQAAFYRLSYLAKNKGKTDLPVKTKSHNFSRLKSKAR